MSKAKEYQKRYNQVDKYMDARFENVITSLRFLVEEMIDTIDELEETVSKNSKAIKSELEISAKKH